MRITKQHLRKIPDLLLRSLGALAIIALNCFLMVWTGGLLMARVDEPLVALLPILGFGSLAFLLVHYFLVGEPTPEPRSQSSPLP